MGTYTVTAVIVHPDPAILKLTLDDEPLATTAEHPFFVLLRGWVKAGDLRVGDQVRQLDGGYGTVTAVEVERQPQLMYNLTVADAHTFFVGEAGWLVHNAKCSLPDGSIGDIIGKITDQETFARGRNIRQVDELVRQYGGQARNWLKKKGTALVELPGGGARTAEVHWYEHPGLGRFRMKVKRWLH